jgi:hypothetical protein
MVAPGEPDRPIHPNNAMQAHQPDADPDHMQPRTERPVVVNFSFHEGRDALGG